MIARLMIAGAVAAAGWYGYSHFATPEDDAAASPSMDHQQGQNTSSADKPVRYIAAVQPVWDGRGTVFRVRPTRAGRTAGLEELRVAWRQVVRRGVPDRSGLRDQFLCHPLSIIARGKPTWDLETWRPSVGLSRTMLNGCNPS